MILTDLLFAIISIFALVIWYLFGPVVRKFTPVRSTIIPNPSASESALPSISTNVASSPAYRSEMEASPTSLESDQPAKQTASSNDNILSARESDFFRNKPQLVVVPYESKDPNIRTLDAMFRYASQKYAIRKLFGTRSIVQFEDVKKEEIDEEGKKKEKIFKIPYKKEYEFITYEAAAAEISRVGAGLVSLGMRRGDLLGLYASTRREWQSTAQACFAHGFPIVTMYPTLGIESLRSVLEEASELAGVVADGSLVTKLLEANNSTKSLKFIVHFDRLSEKDYKLVEEVNQTNVKVISYDELLELGVSKQPPAASPSPSDTALIMYTSGSTGKPKGVVLTHANMMAAIAGLKEIITSPLKPINEDDVLLSYLPLAHVLELAAELTVIACGGAIGFSDPRSIRKEQVRDVETKRYKSDAEALQPTLMTMVPAIAERIKTAIKYSLKRQHWWNRLIFNICYYLKRRNYLRGKPSPFMDKLVFNKIHSRFGGRLRGVLCGGAAMSLPLQEFANICFCCPTVQAYGLTETCGAGTCMDLNDLVDGSVGIPVACCEIKLIERKEMGYLLTPPSSTFETENAKQTMQSTAERKSPISSMKRVAIEKAKHVFKRHYMEQFGPCGEICIRGANVAQGYFKRPDLTSQSFIEDSDGKGKWFLTGDIGEWLPNGHLRVIDRTKDLVKLSNGEYVALNQLETVYSASPMVQWVCVYASPQCDRLFGIVVPDTHKYHIKHRPKDSSQLHSTIFDALLKRGGKANLKKYEMLADIILVEDAWTVESGLITESGKVKRHEVYQKYKSQIQKMEQRFQKHAPSEHEAHLLNLQDLTTEPRAKADEPEDATPSALNIQTNQQPMQVPAIPAKDNDQQEKRRLRDKLRRRHKKEADDQNEDERAGSTKLEAVKGAIKGA